jgi:Domain of unknown function (DUF4157)
MQLGPARLPLLQRRPLQSRESPKSAPPIVHEVLRSPGSQLDDSTRAALEPQFGHDFGRVRVHTDSKAAASAQAVDASAYTVGPNIVFASGQFSPDTAQGRKLLAHELTHTIQQGMQLPSGGSDLRIDSADGPPEREASHTANLLNQNQPFVSPRPGSVGMRVQRDTPPAQATDDTRPVAQIMSDPDYIEGPNLKRIEFFSAQLAILHYADGKQLRLGLVPDYINPPIEGVDYRSERSSHIPILSNKPGKVRYIPRGKESIMQMPDTATFNMQDFEQKFGRDVTFKRDPQSGKIVPTQVNSITAPGLCEILRQAEAEYKANFEAMAQGGKKVFEKLKVIVELLGLADAAQGATEAVAARAASAAAAKQAESTLVRKFVELLAKKAPGQVEVGGVAFGDIEVALEGTELAVRRSSILNVGRVAGQGRVMQTVWESAAIQAAKQSGAKTVQLAMRTIQNPTWAAYLESQGYVWEVLPKLFGQVGVEKALVKVITL